MTEKKKFKLSITILIIIAIILIDQVSKILVINFVKQDVGIITLIKKSEESAQAVRNSVMFQPRRTTLFSRYGVRRWALSVR